MEEPKKVLRAQYLGSLQVTRATGMDILNDAIEVMKTTIAKDQWKQVNVAVAPSMISIMLPGVSFNSEHSNKFGCYQHLSHTFYNEANSIKIFS
jgi:hypothetical protein